MKRILACFTALLILAQGSYATENIYISPSQVLIGQNGIFVKYDDVVIEVPSISCDLNGIYFTEMRAADGDRDHGGSWYCPECETRNPEGVRDCKSCGYHRPRGERDSGPSFGS